MTEDQDRIINKLVDTLNGLRESLNDTNLFDTANLLDDAMAETIALLKLSDSPASGEPAACDCARSPVIIEMIENGTWYIGCRECFFSGEDDTRKCLSRPVICAQPSRAAAIEQWNLWITKKKGENS